jgi:hypothetical protein
MTNPQPKPKPRRLKRNYERGIYRNKNNGLLWDAQLTHEGKTYKVGTFHSRIDAMLARQQAKETLDNGEPFMTLTPHDLQRSRRRAKEKAIPFNPNTRLIANGLIHPGGYTIDSFRNRTGCFRAMPNGTIFWYRRRWWYKVGLHSAWTCDTWSNTQSYFEGTLRVRIPLELVPLPTKADCE